ncbi:hypothetical protein NHX12_001728 [Muraenolepis orangiensis]|uniref:G-protein coupled receptors family 1 profile domain-containing protein n=1 Tax=Muraenolepis orangiensis TaxID=630683 RepID=A0A9Q0E546_9TELE|nr:hypothetical protein NHX12_001728 [Muraenolepis orangiensis]
MVNSTETAVPPKNQTDTSSLNMTINTVMLVINCVVALVGIVGNGLVIYVTGFRMKRTVNSVWFLNLAVADFLFTTFLIFNIISLAQGYHWPFGEFMCKLKTIMSVSNMFASIFFLAVISLDRCLCTWVVVWSQNHRTVRKAQLTCVIIWLAALACSIPFGHFRKIYNPHPQVYFCARFHLANTLALTNFRFTVGFLIPILVITASYVAIGMRTRRFNRERSRKSFRIIIAIILAFVICWIPFHVNKYIEEYAFHHTRNIRRFLGPLSLSLSTANSCLNPVLYVFMCDDFMKKLRQSLFHVLETALAEDFLYFASNPSLSNLSRILSRSDSRPSVQMNETPASYPEVFSAVATSDDSDKTTRGQHPACESTAYRPV